MIEIPLGTTASLRFENAINESQALEQLKSAFPGLWRGVLKEKAWREVTEEECVGAGFERYSIANRKFYLSDESKDQYHEPEIKLIENK